MNDFEGKGRVMQRDVKIGIAIGVLLIALIGIFWWARSSKKTLPPPTPMDTAAVLPAIPEPVAPPVATPGGSPEVTIPGAPKATTAVAAAPTTTVSAAVAPALPGAPTTTLAGIDVPPPVTPTPVTVLPPAGERKYKVVANDSLAKIAKQFYGDESKYKVIAEANKIAAPYNLKPGQELVIPELGSAARPAPKPTPAPGATTATTKPAAAARHHKVAAGETLSAISRRYYGTDAKWKLIYEANKAKMKSPDDLQAGTDLVIPADK